MVEEENLESFLILQAGNRIKLYEGHRIKYPKGDDSWLDDGWPPNDSWPFPGNRLVFTPKNLADHLIGEAGFDQIGKIRDDCSEIVGNYIDFLKRTNGTLFFDLDIWYCGETDNTFVVQSADEMMQDYLTPKSVKLFLLWQEIILKSQCSRKGREDVYELLVISSHNPDPDLKFNKDYTGGNKKGAIFNCNISIDGKVIIAFYYGDTIKRFPMIFDRYGVDEQSDAEIEKAQLLQIGEMEIAPQYVHSIRSEPVHMHGRSRIMPWVTACDEEFVQNRIQLYEKHYRTS